MQKNLKIVFENERFLVGFTNRFGGVSDGFYKSLNLGDNVGDDPQNVVKNRKILALNLGAKSLKFMQQIHCDKVEILRDENDKILPCDGMITDLKGIALCVTVADCSPILIIDESSAVVGAIHAGRAGVVNKICTKAVDLMKREFGSESRNLRAFVGPNIKGGCYEIGSLDLCEFNRYKKGKNFDMNLALADEFSDLGIEVRFDEVCTHCDDRYFSYRRDGVTGRFAGFVMIKGD